MAGKKCQRSSVLHSCIHPPGQPALVRWPGDGQQTYGPVSEAFAEAVADGARAPCHWQE